jgi:hypothetical protein
MAFRTNELCCGFDHGIFCQNEAISVMRVSLGMERIAMEANSYFIQKSAFSVFRISKLVFFVRQLPKSVIKAGYNTPHKL